MAYRRLPEPPAPPVPDTPIGFRLLDRLIPAGVHTLFLLIGLLITAFVALILYFFYNVDDKAINLQEGTQSILIALIWASSIFSFIVSMILSSEFKEDWLSVSASFVSIILVIATAWISFRIVKNEEIDSYVEILGLLSPFWLVGTLSFLTYNFMGTY